MGILLAFAPFIAFALIDRLVGPTEGLIAGALTSAALLIGEWVIARQSPKILEIGTLVLFGGLALYAVLGGPTWSIVGVRLRVDSGLLIIVLITMAVGRPFTLSIGVQILDADPPFRGSIPADPAFDGDQAEPLPPKRAERDRAGQNASRAIRFLICRSIRGRKVPSPQELTIKLEVSRIHTREGREAKGKG